MPCHAAMLSNPPSVQRTDTVGDVLKLMEKKEIKHVAVVDENNVLQGYLSYRRLLANLLPVSVPLEGGGSVQGVTVRAAPGIAKRLRKVSTLPIGDIMERKVHVVYRDTPTWEGINLIVEHGAPVYVVSQENGKLEGVISGFSAYKELHRLQAEI